MYVGKNCENGNSIEFSSRSLILLFTGARSRLQQSDTHLDITLSSVAANLPDEKPSTATIHLKIIEICNIFHNRNSAQATVSIHLTFSEALST